MTRKEFLLHIGLVFFLVSGLASVLKIVADPHLIDKQKKSSVALTVKNKFGTGPYGR